jgi:hypothetical protein
MTTTTPTPSPGPQPHPTSSDDVGKIDAPPAVTPSATTSSANNKALATITSSIGSSILRKFERITSIIDESLESDTLLPSLCHKQGSNNHLNDTSYTSTDDTAIDTSGDTSYQEDSFILSPASLRNECNLHFATWLQSQEFDASGIVSHGDENNSPEETSLLFSRDVFLEASGREENGGDDVDGYVSISEQAADKRGGRGCSRNNSWPPRIPLAMTDVWDSLVSSNWKCWQQHDKGSESPMNGDLTKLSMLHPNAQVIGNQPHNQHHHPNKDSSYVVDVLEGGEIPMTLTRDEVVVKTATDLTMDSITLASIEPGTTTSLPDRPSKDCIKDIGKSSTSTNLNTHPSTRKGTIGDFIWQEESQRPVTSTPSPSLAGSSLVGEDITMTSNLSCTYSVSTVRSESVSRRGRITAVALARTNTAPPPSPVENPPQPSSPDVTTMITTVAEVTTSIDDFEDSFPAVAQLPPDENEIDDEHNCCRAPLMDTSIMNSSDGGDGDQGVSGGGGPTNKETKDRTSKLKLKWAKAKNRRQSSK